MMESGCGAGMEGVELAGRGRSIEACEGVGWGRGRVWYMAGNGAVWERRRHSW